MAKWTDTGDMTVFQWIDIPPVWLLGAMGLVWGWSVMFPGLSAPFGITRAVGALLCLAGIALMAWAVAAFRAHHTSVVPHQRPAHLISSGPFRFSRNPIYLGDLLVLGGAISWWGAWPTLALIPLFGLLLVRRFIAPEERRMKESFGAEFDEFADKTPRWL